MARCSLVPLRLLADDLSKDNFCPLQVQHDHLRVGRRSDLFHYFWRRIVAALPADNITGCSRKSQFTWPHSSSPLLLLAAVVLFVDATGASVLNGASDPLRFSCFGTIQQQQKRERYTYGCRECTRVPAHLTCCTHRLASRRKQREVSTCLQCYFPVFSLQRQTIGRPQRNVYWLCFASESMQIELLGMSSNGGHLSVV